MSYSKRSHRSRKGFNLTAKVAALVAALGLVTIMLERPQLTAAPHRPDVAVEQALSAVDARIASVADVTPEPSASPELPLAVTGSGTAPLYFPGQFPLPDGTVDPQPVGF